MLHIISELTYEVFNLVLDDPVRPHIPPEIRVFDNKEIVVLKDDSSVDKILAVVCIAYTSEVPSTEDFLSVDESNNECSIACLYTIWSYEKGAGKRLVEELIPYFRNNHIKRVVTLSPKTNVAERFHLKNGACIFRENEYTINYEYFLH